MTRSILLDNAKFLLVFLVIFGHLIEPLIKNQETLKTIYLFVYSFHMPAFALISGMLSKIDLDQKQLYKLIETLLIPFVALTLLYELFNFFTKGSISHYSMNLQPYWILWFLYSLFIWKLFLPIILKFRYPLLLTILLSLGAGYFESIGYFLGLSRTIYFFPFFVLGYMLTPQTLMSLKERFSSYAGTIILLAILALNLLFFFFFSEMKHQWLYGSYSYVKLGEDGLSASGMRLLFYAVSLISVMSVLLLISNKRNRYLNGGKHSLYIYVWHGFFIKTFTALGIISTIGKLPVILSLVVFLSISLILAKLLSSEIVAHYTTKFLLQPFQKILLIKS